MASRAKLAESDIITQLDSLPGWGGDTTSLRKSYTFADHITAMGFVNRVALCAEAMDHHPDLRIVYNKVDIVLSTHDAGGVTANDLELAHKIEKYA